VGQQQQGKQTAKNQQRAGEPRRMKIPHDKKESNPGKQRECRGQADTMHATSDLA
jgi:hypothetical protein